jgi:hypothetical protein
MILDAIVKEDGTLIAKAPESLKGKKVRIKIILKEKGEKKSLAVWNEISAILKKADTLDIPPRNPEDIIDDIRSFRESK